MGDFNSPFDSSHRIHGNPVTNAWMIDGLDWLNAYPLCFVNTCGNFSLGISVVVAMVEFTVGLIITLLMMFG